MKLKIKELREEFGMTQKELANKLSNTQRNISNWENGVSEPDCETILKIADLFEVSLDELLQRKHNANGRADKYQSQRRPLPQNKYAYVGTKKCDIRFN